MYQINEEEFEAIFNALEEIQQALEAGACVAASDGSPNSVQEIHKGLRALEWVRGTLNGLEEAPDSD